MWQKVENFFIKLTGGKVFNSGGGQYDTSIGGKDNVFLIIGGAVALIGCVCCCGVVAIFMIVSFLKYNAAGGSISKPEAGHEIELEEPSKKKKKLRVGSSRISAIDSSSDDNS